MLKFSCQHIRVHFVKPLENTYVWDIIIHYFTTSDGVQLIYLGQKSILFPYFKWPNSIMRILQVEKIEALLSHQNWWFFKQSIRLDDFSIFSPPNVFEIFIQYLLKYFLEFLLKCHTVIHSYFYTFNNFSTDNFY